jgi:hypothetical protein
MLAVPSGLDEKLRTSSPPSTAQQRSVAKITKTARIYATMDEIDSNIDLNGYDSGSWPVI